MAIDRRLNQYSNNNAIINGAERIYHEVNAGGECRVPWCTYSSDVEGFEHLNLDRVLQEPGRFNPFKKLRQLETERDKWLRGNEESATLWQYITETWPMRVSMLEREGHKDHGVSFIIALFESLRTDLMAATESVAEKVKVDPDAVTVSSKVDHMTPEARRNVTLNDLHVMLQGLVLSGADVAVKDLHEYVERHVRAAHALVHTSLELEASHDKTEQCYYCIEYGRDRCNQHGS